jgi:carbamoyl-phosphate synthase small subunit
VRTVWLVLADGAMFRGEGFGAEAPSVAQLAAEPAETRHRRLQAVGEVVFNTAMSGYGEVLTDPSYTGQIVVMTYPHAGNYGIEPDWTENGPGDAAADRPPREIKPAGLVVRDLYRGPVPSGRVSLDRYLQLHEVPGITEVDTRALTIHLREHGSSNGLLCGSPEAGLSPADRATALSMLQEFPPMEGRGLIGEVGSTGPVTLPAPHGGGPHLVLYDCGTKANIVRELHALGCTVTLLPATATAEEIRATGADAVLISNGPGDPAVLDHQVMQTRELLGTLPVLGICLGHQIIAEAAGARTFKMPFGHHGVNHPVREEIPPTGSTRGRVFVTSQNHGFSVDETTLPAGMQVWFRNANDGTVEGLRDDARKVLSTQFHPESAPGPVDSRWIFRSFLEVI